MTVRLFCFFAGIFLTLSVSAQTEIVVKGDTLLLPNGSKFWLGEQVTLNSGSLPDKSFNYIYEPEKFRIVKKKPLSGSYSGLTANITKFQRDGVYKGSYSYNIVVLDFGRKKTFWCDVQGALDNNEIVNNLRITIKPSSDKAAQLAKLKKLFDSGEITKEQYETLKSKLENGQDALNDKKPASEKKPASDKKIVTPKKPAKKFAYYILNHCIMKALKLLVITFILTHNVGFAQSAQPKFEFLRQYNGQYAYKVKLLENKKVKQALIALIGLSRYEFVKSNYGVENPIEVKDDVFTSYACQQHNCSDTNFIIVINILDSSVYAGIRENGKVTLYPADTTGIPQITNWLNN